MTTKVCPYILHLNEELPRLPPRSCWATSFRHGPAAAETTNAVVNMSDSEDDLGVFWQSIITVASAAIIISSAVPSLPACLPLPLQTFSSVVQ